MDGTKFDEVLTKVGNGKSQTEACLDSFTTLTHLNLWLAAQPHRHALVAALLQAESDARRTLGRNLQRDLSRRICDGVVASAEHAKSEQLDITRILDEAASLRLRAEKELDKTPVPNPGAKPAPPRTGHWIDDHIAREQVS